MGQISDKHLRRLDIQGFENLTSEEIATFYPWQRLAYGLCALLTLAGVILESHIVLWVLAPIAAAAAIQPVHPFDLIYNFGIRRLTGGGKLPPRAAPGRFACAMGAAWVTATGYAFYIGATTVGYALGAALLVVAGLVSSIDFCIPSTMWRAVFGFPPKRDAAGTKVDDCIDSF